MNDRRIPDKLLNEMIIYCKEHKHDVQSKHACFVIRNNRPIIEYKYNHQSEHAEIVAIKCLFSIAKRRLGLTRSINFSFFIHQLHVNPSDEIIKNILKIMSKYSIVVIRVNARGHLVNSMPCERCLRILRFIRIKTISYSNSNGEIITCRPRDITTRHVSRYYKNNADPLLILLQSC